MLVLLFKISANIYWGSQDVFFSTPCIHVYMVSGRFIPGRFIPDGSYPDGSYSDGSYLGRFILRTVHT